MLGFGAGPAGRSREESQSCLCYSAPQRAAAVLQHKSFVCACGPATLQGILWFFVVCLFFFKSI